MWVQVWDANSSNKLGHPLSQGWGPREGAGEKVEEAAASFPLPWCLHPSDELAPGFGVFSPGQVCQGRLTGFCPVPVGIQGPVLLSVDTRGDRSGSIEDPLGVPGSMLQLPCRAGRQSQAPWDLRHETRRNGVGRFSSTSVGQMSYHWTGKPQVRP